MKFALTLLTLVFTAPAAFATDGCTLQLKDLKSAIDVSKRSVRSKSAVRVNRSDRTINQTIVLKDGQSVKYKAGGCEHYTYYFIYPKVAYTGKADKDLAKARALLEKTPVIRTAAGEKETLLRGLADARDSEDGDSHSFPCGEASCSVSKSSAGEFLVSYSFPL